MNILVLLFAGWNSFFPKFNLWDFMTGYFNSSVVIPQSTCKQANEVFLSFFFPMVYVGCKAYFVEDPIITLDTIDFATELTCISEEDKRYRMDRNAPNVSAYDRTLNAIF
jgi:amino acid transporter